VVYDSVGKDTFDRSVECLKPFGTMVTFGNASGPVPPLDLAKAGRGSLFFTRPAFAAYTANGADLAASAADLFDAVISGKVRIEVRQRYPLREAAQAQRDLEARKTTGSTVLVP
jgi:NADPH2:quinone reductase